MKTISAATFALATLSLSGTSFACAPAPSCWIASDHSYLRSVCRNYAKATAKDIANSLDEPEKVADFVKACSKAGVRMKAE